MNIENPIKNNFEKIFSKLLKKSEITTYQFLRGKFDSGNETYSIWYEAIVGKTNDYRVKFLFEINLQFPEVNFKSRANAKKLTISCSYMCLIDDSRVVATIVSELKAWRKGELHERLFQKRFLEPLQRKYPNIIHNVIKTSDAVDSGYGVDFIIQFKMEKQGLKKELHFNLKSSKIFLDQHTEIHPNVSTFVFVKDDLRDMKILEKNFLLFMSSALSKVVNF